MSSRLTISIMSPEWAKMKEKFFTHLLQCKEEWRNIKENHPLQYMPYMEEHFYAVTGLRLNGLSNFTGWIKRGSYYHRLVARQGQLLKCPHLVGVALPRWPQVTPSESHQVSQKKAETPATSSSTPAQGLARLKGPSPTTYLLPWRQAEWVMAGPGWTRSRPVLMTSFGETGPRNVAGHNRGGGKTDQHFPSRSRLMRGDAHQHSSSTSMQESNHSPTTMWPPWE